MPDVGLLTADASSRPPLQFPPDRRPIDSRTRLTVFDHWLGFTKTSSSGSERWAAPVAFRACWVKPGGSGYAYATDDANTSHDKPLSKAAFKLGLRSPSVEAEMQPPTVRILTSEGKLAIAAGWRADEPTMHT